MSSRKGDGGGFPASRINQLCQGVASLNANDEQDGEWEPVKKPKSRSNPPKQRGGSSSTVNKTWVQPGAAGRGRGKAEVEASWAARTGRGTYKPRSQGNNTGWESAYVAPNPAVIPPPLQNGWQWAARSGPSSQAMAVEPGGDDGGDEDKDRDEDEDDDDEFVDSDDDLSEEYDSDVSQKSFETRKKNKWFKVFFEALDSLSVEEINEPTRQWHCPACQRGPGAIDWYRGLQPLLTHAKTKGSKRVKLHRELADLLEEEVQRKGTSVVPIGEVYGKWKGLSENAPDHMIVWPPMVVVMNTILEKDDNDKWIGMGNQELVDYFRAYDVVKARHAYGPQGHRGMSLLIFESSASGYLEAERLHEHFITEKTHRDAWERHPKLFLQGGQRLLYGFLATKEDMDCFNKHCQGKSRQKFEMRSYQEMVVGPSKQMTADNHQLMWYKNKAAKEQQRSKTLQESLGVLSQKLRQTNEENKVVRLRSKEQHEENKAEMDQQDRFFREQMDKVHRAIAEKERDFEKHIQEERSKARRALQGSETEQGPQRVDIACVLDGQQKEVDEFQAEREKLERTHEDRKAEMWRRHREEEINLEKEFHHALSNLMDKYVGGLKPAVQDP